MTAAVQGRYDVIVAGAGLTGLFAGALAARRGARTLVLARGLGRTHLGPGCIDVWGYEPGGALVRDPDLALELLAGPDHPLRLAGRRALHAALAELQALCTAAGLALNGDPGRNHWLPTAAGASRPTCLAPESFVAGELSQAGEIVLGQLPGFRDFYASYAAANLRALGYAARAVDLDLPRVPLRREIFATDLARLFDQPGYRAEAARLWKPRLEGAARVGLPAVLGYLDCPAAWRDLSERLGRPVFELPLLPPSVPGMRLFNVLREAVEAAGGRVTVGPALRGWASADRPPRVLGVVAHTAGGPRRYAAERVILATGGFLHGGLDAPAAGQARESVFDLPVAAGAAWFAPVYWAAQPYARWGVRVNERMQPLGASGDVIYPNLYAAGGVLAGADRASEGSRDAVSLATAWQAAAQVTA